eukprot:m.69530 g.69530  ORF g.69530 m.69530 type:complete len:332 (+) comp35618_c0_seq1:121-1116(+)
MGNCNRNPEKRREHLRDFGYKFNEVGRLVDLSGEPFSFELSDDMLYCVEYRYMQLLEVLTDDIFDILEGKGGLQRIAIPFDASEFEPTSCFFATPEIEKAEKVMVLVQSTSPYLAGQWDQQTILYKGLAYGSQLPFIHRAKKNGYGVLVMNTNFNVIRQGKQPQEIRGSTTPEIHLEYVWKNFLSRCATQHIDIIVHSTGWKPTVHWLEKYNSARQRVNKVAFVDTCDKIGVQNKEDKIMNWITKHAMNWATSDEALGCLLERRRDNIPSLSAGTTKNDEVMACAYKSLWKFFMSPLSGWSFAANQSNPTADDEDKKDNNCGSPPGNYELV